MSWKYRNSPEMLRASRDNCSYVPFNLRDETHSSPFYHFEPLESLNPVQQTNTDSKEDKDEESLIKAVNYDYSKDLGILDEIKERKSVNKYSDHVENQNDRRVHNKNNFQQRQTINSNMLPNLLKVEGIAAKKENEGNNNKNINYRSSEEFRSSKKDSENCEFVENEYLNNSIILKADGNTKRGLRKIFIFYSKSKSSAFQIQIEQFFVPVYSQITDTSLLLQDFTLWKDYLAKWMKLKPGKTASQVFTSVGFKLKDLHQISKNENFLILQDEEGGIQFWQQFQHSHNLQLNAIALKSLVSSINEMKTKDEMYKVFISPSFLYRLLTTFQSDRTHNNSLTALSSTDQNKSLQLPKIRNNKKIQVGEILNDSNILNASILASPNNQKNFENGNKAKGFNMTQTKNIQSNLGSTNQGSFNNTTQNPVNSFQQNSPSNQATLVQKERLQLVDLYSQYQQILLNSIGKKITNPNLQPSFSNGALLRQFNGVKMKILQSSFPYLAKKREDEHLQVSRSPKPKSFSSQNQMPFVPV